MKKNFAHAYYYNRRGWVSKLVGCEVVTLTLWAHYIADMVEDVIIHYFLGYLKSLGSTRVEPSMMDNHHQI